MARAEWGESDNGGRRSSTIIGERRKQLRARIELHRCRAVGHILQTAE